MSSRNVRYNQGTLAFIHVHVSVESRGLKQIITDEYFLNQLSENCEKCPNVLNVFLYLQHKDIQFTVMED